MTQQGDREGESDMGKFGRVEVYELGACVLWCVCVYVQISAQIAVAEGSQGRVHERHGD